MEENRQRKPRQAKAEITVDNHLNFSARDLYNEIERLRNQPCLQGLKKENSEIKKTLTRIKNLV